MCYSTVPDSRNLRRFYGLGFLVARERLGLFDTPPGSREIRLSLATVGLLVAALVLIIPFSEIRAREINAFVPTSDTIMFLSDLIIATLLYAQATVFRSSALNVLASVHVFNALLIVAHALSFPGAFTPGGLLGGVNTTAWLFVIRRAAFPIAIILYVVLKSRHSKTSPAAEQPTAPTNLWILAAVVLAAAATMLVTVGHDLLPPLFVNRRDAIAANVDIVGLASLALYVVAMAVLFRRRQSVLDVWLLVALSGFLAQMVLNLASHNRFTVGFYFEYVLLVFATLVVMLALIGESNRLYVRLAVATAARNRERETRLMSVNALATSLFREIGQPLAALKLNTSAGLGWLNGKKADPGKAAQSFRAAVEASELTLDLINNVRAKIPDVSGIMADVSLNDLVRETVPLLREDLAAHDITLKLDLSNELPAVRGRRKHLQEVLLNLLTNAMEAVVLEGRKLRTIIVRSGVQGDDQVSLEVTDTGPGIAPDRMGQIFDPFVTTKPTGLGLGLTVSRTIIEDHGGRLWATRNKGNGATFQLTLPRR